MDLGRGGGIRGVDGGGGEDDRCVWGGDRFFGNWRGGKGQVAGECEGDFRELWGSGVSRCFGERVFGGGRRTTMTMIGVGPLEKVSSNGVIAFLSTFSFILVLSFLSIIIGPIGRFPRKCSKTN